MAVVGDGGWTVVVAVSTAGASVVVVISGSRI